MKLTLGNTTREVRYRMELYSIEDPSFRVKINKFDLEDIENGDPPWTLTDFCRFTKKEAVEIYHARLDIEIAKLVEERNKYK